MIRNCVLFRYGSEWTDNWSVDESKIGRVNLKTCLSGAQGRSRKRIEALTEIAHRESLSLASSAKKHHVLVSECEFRMPKPVAAGSPAFVHVSHKMWLRKDSSLVISFDAGRKLSSIGVTLLSYATTGDAKAISSAKIDMDAFQRLKKWTLSSAEGHIKRIALSDVVSGKTRYKQVMLSSNQLESSALFDNLMESSSRVLSMSFTTPKLESTERSLNCRLTHWGGLTIFTPEILDSEMSELIEVMEKSSVVG